MPKQKFPTQKYTTKVQKKTLFPLFDEKFSMYVISESFHSSSNLYFIILTFFYFFIFFRPITSEQRIVPDALLLFIMKDQDFYGAKNDYMAEAYVRISDATRVEKGVYAKQIHLKLNRPFNLGNYFFKMFTYINH